MHNEQIITLVLLVLGAVLIYFGYQSSQSMTGQVYETFMGRFRDATLWYFIFGAVAILSGLGVAAMQLRGSN